MTRPQPNTLPITNSRKSTPGETWGSKTKGPRFILRSWAQEHGEPTITVFSDNSANAFHNTFSFFTSGPKSDPSKQHYDEIVRLLHSFIDESFSYQ